MAGEMTPTPPVKGSAAASKIGVFWDGRMDANAPTSVMEGLYSWVRKQLPTPGARNYAFESIALPLYTNIGAATAQRQFWGLFAQQKYMPAQALVSQGLGGIQHGQVYTPPLIDPYNRP